MVLMFDSQLKKPADRCMLHFGIMSLRCNVGQIANAHFSVKSDMKVRKNENCEM